ncbi:hypothetical protein Tco_1533318 [Tanacetum coccineum]
MLIVCLRTVLPMRHGFEIRINKSIGSRNVAALEVLILELGHVSLNNRLDAWSWKILDDDSFSVQATRFHITIACFHHYVLGCTTAKRIRDGLQRILDSRGDHGVKNDGTKCVASLLVRGKGLGKRKSVLRNKELSEDEENGGKLTRCEQFEAVVKFNWVALDVVGRSVYEIRGRSQDGYYQKALIWELPAAVGSNRFGIDPLSMYTNGAEINQIDATVIDATVSLLKTEFVNKFQESAKRIFPLCKSYLLINEFVEIKIPQIRRIWYQCFCCCTALLLVNLIAW